MVQPTARYKVRLSKQIVTKSSKHVKNQLFWRKTVFFMVQWPDHTPENHTHEIQFIDYPIRRIVLCMKSTLKISFNLRLLPHDWQLCFCQISIRPSNIAWREKTHYWCFGLLFGGFWQILGIWDPKMINLMSFTRRFLSVNVLNCDFLENIFQAKCHWYVFKKPKNLHTKVMFSSRETDKIAIF